jgi:hypothetical protein
MATASKSAIVDRCSIQEELDAILNQERAIDEDLDAYMSDAMGKKTHAINHDAGNISGHLDKIVQFEQCFDAMSQDSKKLAAQIADCRVLSDRLSSLVRRLDMIQIRTQQALACTEDVINLKTCRLGIESALQDKKLQVAVGYVKMVHDIDVEVAKSSDDYGAVMQAERETKALVHEEFKRAVESSDIQTVIALCPTLQTLGLENEARDSFLDFVDKNVFIAVSADACTVDATEPATGYAHALSNIFNTVFAIIQQYLPVVIEGMENSNGDIHFIRKLHARSTKEAGVILKRYMKYRNLKDVVANIKSGAPAGSKPVSNAEMHVMLDEFALMLQYCCSYSDYIGALCSNAENRNPKSTKIAEKPAQALPRIVFDSANENGFDKMVEELVNVYYLECERCIIRRGIQAAIQHAPQLPAEGVAFADKAGMEDSDGWIDECFFVLQRCGMRAIATKNVQAACIVLHLITDHLSGDILRFLGAKLSAAVSKLAGVLTEAVSRWSRRDAEPIGNTSSGAFYKTAFSIASSLTSASPAQSSHAVPSADTALDTGATSGDLWVPSTKDVLEPLNMTSVCLRYVERLTKEVVTAIRNVFGGGSTSASVAIHPSSGSESMAKIMLCRDDFDYVQQSFKKVGQLSFLCVHQ